MTKPFKIAIAGLGTVGCGVVNLLENQRELISSRCDRTVEIVAVSARDRSRDRSADLNPYTWHDDATELADRDDPDCILELIGGEEGIARTIVERGLKTGKHVVTANKALLAYHGGSLNRLAAHSGAELLYEAAIAGGVPVVKALKEGLAANEITAVFGILNGTCNYILSEMERTGAAFDDVLADAQAKGFAETPPDLDIDGHDAAHKICLLSAIASGNDPDMAQVDIKGIRAISQAHIAEAQAKGEVIRLIAGTTLREDGSWAAQVVPQHLPFEHPLARIGGVQNAVLIEAQPVGQIMLTGLGAGAGPTASAVVADVIDLAKRSNL